jgi:hypothetical protein
MMQAERDAANNLVSTPYPAQVAVVYLCAARTLCKQKKNNGHREAHFVFATGSMYLGMMFVGWDTHHTSEKVSSDRNLIAMKI